MIGMITGAHFVLYSKNATADRRFLRKVFGFPSVDLGQGWLVFGLPHSEFVVHPSEENASHELYLICDDVKKLITTLKAKKVKCTPPDEQRWGVRTWVSLPGGGRLVVYQPKHRRPPFRRVPTKKGRIS